MPYYCYAKLDDEQLNKLRSVEQETGKTILVFREVDIHPDQVAPEDLSKLKDLEKQLGYIAVAVKK